MPIEFRCTQCEKLLRVPDATGGKKAKCPECGTVLTIPETTPSAALEPAFRAAPVPPLPQEGADLYRSASAAGPETSQGEVRRGFHPTRIELSDVLSRTWAIYKSNLWMCVGATVSVFVLNIAVGICGNVITRQAGQPAGALFQLIATAANFFLTVGILTFMLKVARGEDAEFADLFSGGPLLLPALGVSILTGLCVLVGFILLIIPGIIVAFMLGQSLLVLIDQRTGVVDSLRYSAAATRGNKFTLFALAVVLFGIVILVGLPTCGLGLIFVYPYSFLMFAVAYLMMTGQSTAADVAPAQRPAF